MSKNDSLLNLEKFDLNKTNLKTILDDFTELFPWHLLNFIESSNSNSVSHDLNNVRSPESQLSELVSDVMIPEQQRVYAIYWNIICLQV